MKWAFYPAIYELTSSVSIAFDNFFKSAFVSATNYSFSPKLFVFKATQTFPIKTSYKSLLWPTKFSKNESNFKAYLYSPLS